MIVNPYNNGIGKIKNFFEKKNPVFLETKLVPFSMKTMDKFLIKSSKKRAREYLNKQEFPLFQTIEIETINRCNGKCSFCPINRNIDPRPFKLMDQELFEDIISQLKNINYTGSMGLYSNNEPLLDKRLFEFLKYARKELPNATLYLFTNGTLLTVEKFKELLKYLDWITIDNYNDDLILHDQVKEVYEYALTLPKERQENIHIYFRKENEILSNRSGEANNRSKNDLTMKSACMYPFEQVVVRPDGKLSLCCNDAVGNMTMGDLTKELLVDIWNGDKYKIIRNNMLKDRNLNKLCSRCDIVTPRVPKGTSFNIKSLAKMVKQKLN